MDMLHIAALAGLEWLYDGVEKRYGGGAASLVTITAALTLIGLIVWIMLRFVFR